MDSNTQLYRYEAAHRLLISEFNSAKDELTELKREMAYVMDENKKLRRDLKDALANQLQPLERELSMGVDVDQSIAQNLEKQLDLMRKERENAMQMWQKSLTIIAQLEQELKSLQFHTAPQTMSFEIELKRKQEEFARTEVTLQRELSMARAESNKKTDDLIEARLQHTDLRLQIENLNVQLSQKDQERRNMIQKEYGYDDALLSLQNDINDLQTKLLTTTKDSQQLRESLRESQMKASDLERQNVELERKLGELRSQLEEQAAELRAHKVEQKKGNLNGSGGSDQRQQREEHERLHDAIGQLMDEAALKTRQEVSELRNIYNANLSRLIEECNMIESDRSNKEFELEKIYRLKKSIEQELEKALNENMRLNSKDNSVHQELHRRMCLLEKDKELALSKLEMREDDIKQLQRIVDNEREKSETLIVNLNEKVSRSTRDFEQLTDEHAKLLAEHDQVRVRLAESQSERDALQKKLTKQIQLHESAVQIINSEQQSRARSLEESHMRGMFELRQLLDAQQRMSNKWKEECHAITRHTEAKFTEMSRNYENIRTRNEQLYAELQERKRKELERDREAGLHLNKIKTLEIRVRDAEQQATEATKRVAKLLAREKMIAYEKHLLEADLERTQLTKTYANGSGRRFADSKVLSHQLDEASKLPTNEGGAATNPPSPPVRNRSAVVVESDRSTS